MSNSSSLLSISSIDSVIFFGSKKQEINPNFSFSPSVIPLSTNSASINSKGISVSTPAPSPVPSANLAPLWSRLERHSRIFKVIPCVLGIPLEAIKPTPQESFSSKLNVMET